ncbi:MAG: Ig-like domain-containing protein [Vicinamibacterales bacterium]
MKSLSLTALLVLSCVTAACSKGSDGPTSPTGPSPTAPASPTATALTISSASNLVLVGSSASLTATVAFSDGTTRQVTATWTSDNAAVATVDGSGRVTATGAGLATITASAEGRSGTLVIRGLPDFAGNWRVQVRELSCDVPPRWGAGFCNVSGLVTMTVLLTRADGDRVVGTVDNGIGWTGAVSGQVSLDGTLSLSGRLSSVRPTVTFHSDYSDWQTRLSPTVGMTGTFREILTWVGEPDQGFVMSEVIRASR